MFFAGVRRCLDPLRYPRQRILEPARCIFAQLRAVSLDAGDQGFLIGLSIFYCLQYLRFGLILRPVLDQLRMKPQYPAPPAHLPASQIRYICRLGRGLMPQRVPAPVLCRQNQSIAGLYFHALISAPPQYRNPRAAARNFRFSARPFHVRPLLGSASTHPGAEGADEESEVPEGGARVRTWKG